MIGRLNHVAIAVPDLKAASAQYRDTLGAKVGAPQDEPDHGVTVVFIELPNTKIELLYPLGDASPIRGFLEKNPSGGIHHICYEVDDIIAARDHLFLPALSVIDLKPHHTPNALFAGADNPNFFMDISGTLDTKIDSIVFHESQMTRLDGWRDRVRRRAADVGKKGGLQFAEGFHLLELR